MVVSGLPTTSRRPIGTAINATKDSTQSISVLKEGAVDGRSTQEASVSNGHEGLHAAAEIASFALQLLDSVKHFRIRHRPSDTLMLRIGVLR